MRRGRGIGEERGKDESNNEYRVRKGRGKDGKAYRNKKKCIDSKLKIHAVPLPAPPGQSSCTDNTMDVLGNTDPLPASSRFCQYLACKSDEQHTITTSNPSDPLICAIFCRTNASTSVDDVIDAIVLLISLK